MKKKRLNKDADYKLGINTLKTYLLNNGLYHIYYNIVNNDKWVFKLSELLAKRGICELFWKNTVEQEYISNIIACETIEDIFYDNNEQKMIKKLNCYQKNAMRVSLLT